MVSVCFVFLVDIQINMDVEYKERKLIPVPFDIIRDVGLNTDTPEQKKV